MEVILLEKVANLGNIGDRVKVRSGFGRNFLLPQGKATLATPDNIARFEARRAELERVAREHLSSAGERAEAMKDSTSPASTSLSTRWADEARSSQTSWTACWIRVCSSSSQEASCVASGGSWQRCQMS